jgi:hypothetical protein
MYLVVWQFDVKPSCTKEFQTHYSSAGTWAIFFRKGIGYLGSQLLVDTGNPYRYVTIDRWESKLTYDAFRASNADEYQRIDHLCGELTESEEFVADFEEEKRKQ